MRKRRQAHLEEIIARLERLSADSPWAHRASGLRRALIRALETKADAAHTAALEQEAYRILNAAARQIPEEHPKKR